MREITRGLCSRPEQCLWCSTEEFGGLCMCEDCGDRVERLCMVPSAKTGCSNPCNRLLFMKQHSVSGSGNQGQPKSTHNVLISGWDKAVQRTKIYLFWQILKWNMGVFFMSLPQVTNLIQDYVRTISHVVIYCHFSHCIPNSHFYCSLVIIHYIFLAHFTSRTTLDFKGGRTSASK